MIGENKTQMQSSLKSFISHTPSLINLYEAFESQPAFKIIENEIKIDLDNITFGPQRYTIQVLQKSLQHARILYFAILYYLFESKHRNDREVANNALDIFIAEKFNLYEAEDLNLGLSLQQIKIYLLKFLQILTNRSQQNKVVIEELERLPQIDRLLLVLIRAICGDQWLTFAGNQRQIQAFIKVSIGLDIELLTQQLIIIENCLKIEIKRLGELLQFTILHETPQELDRVRMECEIAQKSAMFYVEEEQPVQRFAFSNKLIRKSTIKSNEFQSQPEGLNETDQESLEIDEGISNDGLINFNLDDFNPEREEAPKIKLVHKSTMEEEADSKIEKKKNFYTEPQEEYPISKHDLISEIDSRQQQIFQNSKRIRNEINDSLFQSRRTFDLQPLSFRSFHKAVPKITFTYNKSKNFNHSHSKSVFNNQCLSERRSLKSSANTTRLSQQSRSIQMHKFPLTPKKAQIPHNPYNFQKKVPAKITFTYSNPPILIKLG